MLVYVILNKASGKVYVGQTQRTLKKRWLEHLQSASRPSSPIYDTYFCRAIRKYGADAFLPITLREVSTKEELDKEERRFIALYQSHKPQSGYNCTLGGGGCVATEETKKKMSASLKLYYSKHGSHCKGTKLTDEHKAALLAANLGRAISDETRRRMSEANTGRVVSEAQKKVRGEQSLARWADPEFRQKMKTIADAHKGPRPEWIGQKISAAKKSKLRGKETELKIVRCLGGLSYAEIAEIYGVSTSAVCTVCRGLGGYRGGRRKSYGAPTLTTKEYLVAMGLITDALIPTPVTAFSDLQIEETQLPHEDIHLKVKEEPCAQVL